MLNILFEDQSILVVEKPAGLESQSAKGFGADMVSEIRKHIHMLSPEDGELYVGVIHRLDKPVQGIMVYAKTKKAAAALSKQVQNGQMKKTYQAVVCGKLVEDVGNCVDYLLKEERGNCTHIVEKGEKGAKRAELRYQVMDRKEIEGSFFTLVEIELLTGRHHQIRVQFSGRGFPIAGDKRYGQTEEAAGLSDGRQSRGVNRSREELSLCAVGLSFCHPDTNKRMEFRIEPNGTMFRKFKQ